MSGGVRQGDLFVSTNYIGYLRWVMGFCIFTVGGYSGFVACSVQGIMAVISSERALCMPCVSTVAMASL
jgi:hypothetical protein